jgi:hypothetical protein
VQRVTIYSDDLSARCQRDEISTDATTQIRHPDGVGESRRTVLRNDLGGRLLQTNPGEVHLLSAGELRVGAEA